MEPRRPLSPGEAPAHGRRSPERMAIPMDEPNCEGRVPAQHKTEAGLCDLLGHHHGHELPTRRSRGLVHLGHQEVWPQATQSARLQPFLLAWSAGCMERAHSWEFICQGEAHLGSTIKVGKKPLKTADVYKLATSNCNKLAGSHQGRTSS